MSFRCWIAFWLLFSAKARAQSGDGEMDIEPRITCTSHLSLKGSSITCNIAGSSDFEDDEDVTGGGIHNITVCYYSMLNSKEMCLESQGNTLKSKEIPAITKYNITIQTSRGKINGQFHLMKIVKPKHPQVWNATFYPQQDKAVIYIQIPYQDDFLKTTNQIFQLHIRTNNIMSLWNMTESLVIEGERLQKNTVYYVKVRAIPYMPSFQGTWSEWSPTVHFSTNITKDTSEEKPTPLHDINHIVIGGFVIFFLVTSIGFCRKRIYTLIYTLMCPSIPHPKQILKIYQPIMFLPVSFNPESLSDNIYPVHKVEAHHSAEEEPLAQKDTSKLKESCGPKMCSGDTTGSTTSNTSINTTESLSTLLSGSSRGEEEFPQLRSRASTLSSSPEGEGQGEALADPITTNRVADMTGVTQHVKEDSYVTMSSFYQIK